MRLALIGVGLIGGSAAAAFRAAGALGDGGEVIGVDADPRASAEGVRLGVLDRAAGSIAQAVQGADLVLLAVPVGAMRAVLIEVAPHVAPHAVVTDVGSTKRSVIEAARATLGAALPRFVPAHPIAGGELPGVAQADAGLFRGKRLITTATADTDVTALAQVEALWAATGADVIRMDADEHDRIFAAVSHLPHLLSFALVAQIAGEHDGARKLGFAGGGFRDFTRIAASSPVMWRDIALANRAALSTELAGYRAMLDSLQQAIDAADGAQLAQVFELASRTRRAAGSRGADSE